MTFHSLKYPSQLTEKVSYAGVKVAAMINVVRKLFRPEECQFQANYWLPTLLASFEFH